MYSLIRPLLFMLNPEAAHICALKGLCLVPRLFFPKLEENPVEVMGIQFKHTVGLAAGLDKNGEYIDSLSKLGFAFIEVGTVTPKPQLGNPKPRLFRIKQAQALINRMGFNNHGVDVLVNNLKKSRYEGVLGINIGKNKDTDLNRAAEDYVYCLNKVYAYASYITINISSPNTPELRQLQQDNYFYDLIKVLSMSREKLITQHQRYVPLVIKVSPDETEETLKKIADVVLSMGIDGIIATNTTCNHVAVQSFPSGNEAGGVSGAPVFEASTHCLRILKQCVGNDVALIGVGGINSPDTANQKLAAGASLLQVYTGLIYQGPYLIKQLAKIR